MKQMRFDIHIYICIQIKLDVFPTLLYIGIWFPASSPKIVLAKTTFGENNHVEHGGEPQEGGWQAFHLLVCWRQGGGKIEDHSP